VHESSHAFFNLPDEYCCDGGYYNKPPVLYPSSASCNSDANNSAWRNCVSFTASDGTTWWRSEGNYTSDEIMISGGSVVLEMGPGDWSVASQVYSSFGSPSVGTPSVFAPANWNNPNTP
jgi:hypothetical protein